MIENSKNFTIKKCVSPIRTISALLGLALLALACSGGEGESYSGINASGSAPTLRLAAKAGDMIYVYDLEQAVVPVNPPLGILNMSGNSSVTFPFNLNNSYRLDLVRNNVSWMSTVVFREQLLSGDAELTIGQFSGVTSMMVWLSSLVAKVDGLTVEDVLMNRYLEGAKGVLSSGAQGWVNIWNLETQSTFDSTVPTMYQFLIGDGAKDHLSFDHINAKSINQLNSGIIAISKSAASVNSGQMTNEYWNRMKWLLTSMSLGGTYGEKYGEEYTPQYNDFGNEYGWMIGQTVGSSTSGYYMSIISESEVQSKVITAIGTDGTPATVTELTTSMQSRSSQDDLLPLLQLNQKFVGMPQNLLPTRGTDQIVVSWDVVSGAASYNIYWSTSSGVTVESSKLSTVENLYTHTGLSAGTTYYYRATALNVTGESALSTETTATLDSFLNGDFNLTLNSTQVGTSNRYSFTGWTVLQERIQLDGLSSVLGYATPIDGTDPTNGPIIDNSGTSTAFSYSHLLTTSEPSLEGGIAMQLSQTGSVSDRYGIIHGPTLYSDPIYIKTNSKVQFEWKAASSGDAYDVFAYLLNTDNGSTIELLNETGSSNFAITQWATVQHNVALAGNYVFVFISGTFDFSGGGALGARLLIDNVSIVSQ